MSEMLRADERSQPLLRVPRERTPAELMLDDGDRAYCLLFVPQGDSLDQVFDEPRQFVPVAVGARARFVARDAIACISVHVLHAPSEDDLPREHQRAKIILRGGHEIRGDLRWVGAPGRNRTLDHLNEPTSNFGVYDGDYVHFVAKAHVMSVEEI